jgi:hypothetical protein
VCEDKHTNYYEVLNEEDDVDASSMLAQANGTDREILCCGVNSSDTRATGSTEGESIFPNTQELETNTKSIRGEDQAIGEGLSEHDTVGKGLLSEEAMGD